MNDNEESDDEINWDRELFQPGAKLTDDLLKIKKNQLENKVYDKTIEELKRKGLFDKFDFKQTYNNKMKSIKNFLKIEKGASKLNKLISTNIKGTKIGVLDTIFLANDLYDVWNEKDSNLNQKLYKSGQEISGAIGSYLGANLGVSCGTAIGAYVGTLICPGVGSVVGAVAGFGLGILGSIFGSKIGKAYYDFRAYMIKKSIDFYSGILGFFRSGGVEFIFPKEIPEFKENFSFDKIHFFAFEYEDDKNNFNINEIINLVNSKFLEIKISNLDELFDTILMEIAQGFLYQKNLPSISLNFNKEGLLYSIMNDFYKNTITGNILTFLDYYLKSYVNGGFFKEEFIFNWQNDKNVDKNFLQKNIIDFKKYLFELNHNPNDINYISMYDLNINPKNDNNYISAFRIIGNIKNNLKYYKNIIFPNCSYFTQYDFDILPDWQSKIEIDSNEKNSSELIKNNHKLMAARVTFLMKKIPFLKPYFEILKIITFAIHYLPNIQKIGLFPIFSNSLQNKKIGEKYCKSIPKVFPPLPIRKRINIEVNINTKEIIEIFKENNYEKLNQFISICFYETDKLKIEKAIEKQKFLLDKIKYYIREKVKNNIAMNDRYVINFFSDKNLKIPEIEKEFINNIFYFPLIDLLEDYFFLYNLLNLQENILYKPKKNKEYIFTIRSFENLKKEIEEILNLFAIYKLELIEKKEENKKILKLIK